MTSIKIKNFGPIKEGYADNDGFIPIDRFMAFIGNQGSGKSSVVKLISMFSWMEKALSRGNRLVGPITEDKGFDQYCKEQQVQNYFQTDDGSGKGTFIEYIGTAYNFKYGRGKLSIIENKREEYRLPKVSFIPAERNFISVIEEASQIKHLPSTLSWCLEEFNKACRGLDNPIDLPINEIKFSYDKLKKMAYIHGTNSEFNLKLSEASSGIQSVVPLFIILDYLNKFISDQGSSNFSVEEKELLQAELRDIISKETGEIRTMSLNLLFSRFKINHLVTIIEEIEQNLFPDSQRSILNKALEFTNNLPDNKLILTTHSPYIIGYMTLAMKGYLLLDKIKDNVSLKAKLNKVVPIKSCFKPEDVAIYELDMEGNIKKVNSNNGIISGKNYLNEKMKEENTLFDKLLEIEEELEWVK